MNQYKNIAKAKAIEQKNRKRLLKVNPDLTDEINMWEGEVCIGKNY